MTGLGHSRLADDHLFGLCIYAAGFRFAQAAYDLMAVNWIGMPLPPEVVTTRGIKVIHPIKGNDLAEQASIRSHFARQRKLVPEPA